jgi:hypothetical protein
MCILLFVARGRRLFFSSAVFYPAISLRSLSLWNCISVGNLGLYLVDDLSVKCSGPDYQLASVFNAIFVVGVVAGWPAFLVCFECDSLTL